MSEFEETFAEKFINGYIRADIKTEIPKDIMNIILVYCILFESDILYDNKSKSDFIQMISKYINHNKCIRLNRLYSGLNDGFKSSILRSKCNNKGGTIALIFNHYGAIFGGYTSVSFNNNSYWYRDDKAFLFNFFPNGKIFALKNKNNNFAVGGHKYWMVVFGQGFDLIIVDDCDMNTNSYVNSNSYSFDAKKFVGGPKHYSSKNHFKVFNIEIFQVLQ